MSTSSNICVKGGKINYEIVKDLSIEEKLKKIIEYTEQLMEYEDTDNTMFRLKLINLYKDYLYLDDDISYNDADKIDYYYHYIIGYLNTMLMIDDKKFHAMRLKHELGLQDDLTDAFEKLFYFKTGQDINNPIKLNSNKFIRGVFNDYIEQFESYTIKSCKDYFTKLSKRSNPDYELNHNITLFVNNDQINKYVLNNIKSFDGITKSIYIYGNIYRTGTIDKSITALLENKTLNTDSSSKTIEYVFNNYKRGIYVMIKNSRVKIFAPFDNKNYKNDWHNKIKFDGANSLKDYLKTKPKDKKYKPLDNWYIDGNIIHNVDEPISDDGFLQLRNMFDELCGTKIVSDCEFIINLNKTPINDNKKDNIPILSFSVSKDDTDICIPNPEDWELATQLIFPKGKNVKLACTKDYSDELFLSNKVHWVNKKNIAVFRGSCSGIGINENTNQRIKLINQFGKNKNFDIKFTSHDHRDRIIDTDDMIISNIKLKELKQDIGKHHYMTMLEQMKYKYIIYIDGIGASSRYSFMMKTGSVILKVDSPNKLWFSGLLIPYIDHIPVKSDLSDLEDKLEWCNNNQSKCKMIADSAFNLYNKILTKGSIMDYLGLICYRISDRYDNNMKINNDLDIKYNYKLNYYKHKLSNIIQDSDLLKDVSYPEIPNIDIVPLKQYNKNLKELINKKIELDKCFSEYLNEYEISSKQLINNIYTYIDN